LYSFKKSIIIENKDLFINDEVNGVKIDSAEKN
jgi:hypothetical protein